MAVEQEPLRDEAADDARHHWIYRFMALLYVLFCFELGVFLLMYPWTDWWLRSFFSGLGPSWYVIWSSPYLRGAVSGLGLVDIGISFAEVFRLRRFAGSAGQRSLQ